MHGKERESRKKKTKKKKKKKIIQYVLRRGGEASNPESLSEKMIATSRLINSKNVVLKGIQHKTENLSGSVDDNTRLGHQPTNFC